jgi:hypothetical protein
MPPIMVGRIIDIAYGDAGKWFFYAKKRQQKLITKLYIFSLS